MANFTSHMLLVFFSLIFVDRSNFCLDTSKLISFPHLTKCRCFNVLMQSLSENANSYNLIMAIHAGFYYFIFLLLYVLITLPNLDVLMS